MSKASSWLLIMFIIVIPISFGITYFSLKIWPQTKVSMTVDHFPYCFYYQDTKEITCFQKDYFEQNKEKILNNLKEHGRLNWYNL